MEKRSEKRLEKRLEKILDSDWIAIGNVIGSRLEAMGTWCNYHFMRSSSNIWRFLATYSNVGQHLGINGSVLHILAIRDLKVLLANFGNFGHLCNW